MKKNFRPDRKIFVLAAIVTILMFVSIYIFNIYLNTEREDFLQTKMDDFIVQYEDMQVLNLMSNAFGQEMTCLAMKSQLSRMDTTLWDIGMKIDKYRMLTEEYMKNPFYLEQKITFNKNEIVYLSMLKEIEKKCNSSNPIVLFFYRKSELCPNCDAQSFVLTDIKRDYDENISIFSFDSDLEIQAVNLLADYYDLKDHPCTVIDDKVHCGLLNKKEVVEAICSEKNYAICRS